MAPSNAGPRYNAGPRGSRSAPPGALGGLPHLHNGQGATSRERRRRPKNLHNDHNLHNLHNDHQGGGLPSAAILAQDVVQTTRGVDSGGT